MNTGPTYHATPCRKLQKPLSVFNYQTKGFGRVKVGHWFTNEGIGILDRALVCDRGVLPKTKDMALIPRTEVSHKGTYGTVGIVVSPQHDGGGDAGKSFLQSGLRAGKDFPPEQFTGFFNVSILEAVVVLHKTDDVGSER